jgi:hypothetical protein
MYLMHLLIDTKNSYNKSNALVIVSAVPFISAGAFQQLRWIAGVSRTQPQYPKE